MGTKKKRKRPRPVSGAMIDDRTGVYEEDGGWLSVVSNKDEEEKPWKHRHFRCNSCGHIMPMTREEYYAMREAEEWKKVQGLKEAFQEIRVKGG